jgi:RHS repeat-associated protein
MTDSLGNLEVRLEYDPYGIQSSVGTLCTTFGFTGHYYHGESGLDLTVNRAYDSQNARWLTRDPIEEAAGLNMYSYVSNDPINVRDPLGRSDNKVADLANKVYDGINGLYKWYKKAKEVKDIAKDVNGLVHGGPKSIAPILDRIMCKFVAGCCHGISASKIVEYVDDAHELRDERAETVNKENGNIPLLPSSP